MNLKEFLAKRDNPPELYWSIVIEENTIQAGIWQIEGNSAVVVSLGISASYEGLGDLIQAVDSSLSSCMQTLSDDSSEPKKTVFAVPGSWVSGGEIKDEYIERIKKICDELSLEASGFVVISEAISNLYNTQEGAPLTSIVVGFFSQNLEISVFKLGKLLGNTSVLRSVNLIEDVLEGLSRFASANPLPSRMIVYGSKDTDVENIKNELDAYSWDDLEKIKFLHTPKTEILEQDKIISATSLAGAVEIGQNVTGIQIDKKNDNKEDLNISNVIPVENVQTEELRDLGFSIDEDITQEVKKPEVEDKNKIVLPKLSIPSMPKIKLPSIKFKIAPLVMIFAGLLALLILGFVFLPKVKIVVDVAPKSFESSFDVNFNKNNSQSISVKKQNSKTNSTTGKKTVGEKAKGEVEIANGNASSIKLTSGTLITSSSGIKFYLSQDASVSGQLLPGSPGISVVSVVASEIGSSFNLAKGEIFSVGNYAKSLVAATSKSDFSGGSSREINSVSKEDREKIVKDLTEELVADAVSEIQNQVTSDKFIIPGYLVTKIENQEFDRKVGDEATSITLDLEISVEAIEIDSAELFNLTKEKLSDIAPAGFALKSDQVKYVFNFVDEKDGDKKFKVNVKANYLPSVNIDDILSKMRGKTLNSGISYLKTIPGYRSIKIKFNSNLFSSMGILPIIKSNIDVEIGAEE